MSIGIWQILLIILVIVLLFGRGRISEFMGDFAKGIRSFRKGLTDEDQTPPPGPKPLPDGSQQGEAQRREDRTPV